MSKYYGVNCGGVHFAEIDGKIWECLDEKEYPNAVPRRPCDCCVPSEVQDKLREDGIILYEEWKMLKMFGRRLSFREVYERTAELIKGRPDLHQLWALDKDRRFYHDGSNPPSKEEWRAVLISHGTTP